MSDSESHESDVDPISDVPCISGQPSCGGAFLRNVWPFAASGKNVQRNILHNSVRTDVDGAHGALRDPSPDLKADSDSDATAGQNAEQSGTAGGHSSPLKRGFLGRMRERASSPFHLASDLSHRMSSSSSGRDKSPGRVAASKRRGKSDRSPQRSRSNKSPLRASATSEESDAVAKAAASEENAARDQASGAGLSQTVSEGAVLGDGGDVTVERVTVSESAAVGMDISGDDEAVSAYKPKDAQRIAENSPSDQGSSEQSVSQPSIGQEKNPSKELQPQDDQLASLPSAAVASAAAISGVRHGKEEMEEQAMEHEMQELTVSEGLGGTGLGGTGLGGTGLGGSAALAMAVADTGDEKRRDEEGAGGKGGEEEREKVEDAHVAETLPSPVAPQRAAPEDEPVMLDSLDRCLKLLSSGNKSKVTMALVAVLAYVASGDVDNMNNVYDALPFALLEEAFAAAVAKGSSGPNGMVEEEELVHAALAVLALLLQEPDLAYAPQTMPLVPHLVGLIRSGYDPVVAVDAYECLLGVATGSDAGLKAVKGADVLGVVAENIQRSEPGCESLPSAIQLLGFLFMSGVSDIEMYEYKHELAAAVPTLARELAQRTDMLKYEVLKLLVAMLSSDAAEPVKSVVQTFDSGSEGRQWAHHMRAGLAGILLDSTEEEFRKDALQLVRVLAEIQGHAWLVESGDEGSGDGVGVNGLSAVRPSPADRFLLVVLQAVKLEMPPLLQELAVLTLENEEEEGKEGGEGGEGGEGEEGEGAVDGEEKDKMNADAAWAALGGNLDRFGPGNAGKAGGGLGRAGGLGKGEITRMNSLVPTSEDWRSVVNEMVWEPPKDGDDDAGALQIEEEVPEETGPPEEVKRLYRVLGDCYALVEKVVGALAGAAAEAEKGRGKGAGEEKDGEEGGKEVQALVARLGVETVKLCVKIIDAIVKDVLIFLQLAQERERYSHDGVLAAIKLLGSYLTVAPSSHRKRVGRLLGFMLGVKGEDEDRPLLASRYLLPALVHMSSEARGCNTILKRGGHRFLIEYIAETGRTNMTGQLRSGAEGQTSLMQAADVILNLFSF
ncbi:hypothetical protein CLOM_g6899, partial [Closterium sp. NIES-68]